MRLNEVYYGFELVEKKALKEYDSTLFVFKHHYSDGTLVYLKNNDTNKCFAAGFRTLPEDSTGIAHIIEHSLLCGSQKYPLKEPFVNLLKGSMASFLNAMTASDFTVYPVASQNNKDFDNLMSCYLDAVFAPLSIIDEKPFLQEGWHLEMKDCNDVPSIKGVVYNEMKGAMSNVNRILAQRTNEALYEGTGYACNSGGEPDCIPNLTYEYYKEFYKNHYHPENGVLYLYGKMNILDKLKMIDSEYLSKFPKQGKATKIEIPKALKNRNAKGEYAIGKQEPLENNTYMSLAFALPEFNDTRKQLAFAILDQALMATNDSPLKKKLLAAKLGEDISSSIDDDCILPSYAIYLQKTNKDQKKNFYDVFMKSVKEIIEEGIDQKLLLATINSFEFQRKEMDSGRMPKGLIPCFSIVQAFIYGTDYKQALECSSHFAYFKKHLADGYFEKLLRNVILRSKHYVQYVLTPSNTLASKKEALMKKQMLELKKKMTKEEIEACVLKTKELIAYQSKHDTKEELATLPSLKMADISSKVNSLDSVIDENRIYYYENTNGIGYLSSYFDLKALTKEELPYAVVLATVLGQLDTEKYSAQEIKNYVDTYLGKVDLRLILEGKGKEEIVAKMALSVSALSENVSKISEILNEILMHTKYEKEKISLILTQLKITARNQIFGNGTAIAITEASSQTSKAGALKASVSNVKMLKIFEDMLNDMDNTCSLMTKVSQKIFRMDNRIVSFAGDRETVKALEEQFALLDLNKDEYANCLEVSINQASKQAIVIPSEVNYNACVINLSDLAMTVNGPLMIASHILRYDYLWPEVRVKGGAYGCNASAKTSTNEFVLSSYRDPNVVKTYQVFANAASYLANFKCEKPEFISYLIGAIGSFDQPASIASMISSEDYYYLLGITKEMREQLKKEMIHTTIKDVNKVSALFEKMASNGAFVTIGNETKIKEYSFNETKEL